MFAILQKEGEAICNPGEFYLEKDLTQHEDFLRWNVKNYMMVPVRRQDGKTIGVLGAVNMKRRWETAEPLEQVALSFSITAEQCASYQRLDLMSQTDAMTGLMNRKRYHEVLLEMKQAPYRSFACVYVDANGLHEINNRLGHLAGDQMLIRTAKALKEKFISDPVFRIGGDEFVVLCRNRERQWVYDRAEAARSQVKKYGYEMSVGIEWRNQHIDVMDIVNTAESRMGLDKQQYYENNGSERQNRLLDEKTARLIAEKQDMDTFLAVLAPQFKGVYFVDLSKDTIRYLFIPSYFKEILREEDGKFSKGLLRYSYRLVKPEYQGVFEDFCNYDYLKNRLEQEAAPEFRYQKKDGTWLKLQVLYVKHSEGTGQETLWLFSTAEA
ncbi:MAG: sensor domain-containing diguanylate cyclase [Lachnospiraceae bacterium]|nr:sensor domain-containing diguanylate cyclase [Lachnospiraceae bacterium]